MTKKRLRKKASKNDVRLGQIDERTKHLVATVNEIKKGLKDFSEDVDDKFKTLRTCVDTKFDRHNDFHTNQGKKYTRLFLVVGALAVASLIANPEGIIIAVKFLLRAF